MWPSVESSHSQGCSSRTSIRPVSRLGSQSLQKWDTGDQVPSCTTHTPCRGSLRRHPHQDRTPQHPVIPVQAGRHRSRSETFLKPHQHVGTDLLLNGEPCQVYRADRTSTDAQNLSNRGVMIACATSLLPQNLQIAHSPLLEVKAITVTTPSKANMCIVTVYRRPQLPLATFLTLLRNYTSPTFLTRHCPPSSSETSTSASPRRQPTHRHC